MGGINRSEPSDERAFASDLGGRAPTAGMGGSRSNQSRAPDCAKPLSLHRTPTITNFVLSSFYCTRTLLIKRAEQQPLWPNRGRTRVYSHLGPLDPWERTNKKPTKIAISGREIRRRASTIGQILSGGIGMRSKIVENSKQFYGFFFRRFR